MLDKIPSSKELSELMGENIFKVWQETRLLIEGLYDMDQSLYDKSTTLNELTLLRTILKFILSCNRKRPLVIVSILWLEGLFTLFYLDISLNHH